MEDFAKSNQMVINHKKLNIMMFNRAKNYTFPPELSFEDGSFLTVISEVKLLGVIISDDLKWAKTPNIL